MFIHDVLDELITCGETDVSSTYLSMKMKELSGNVPGTNMTGYEEQFMVHTIGCLQCEGFERDPGPSLVRHNILGNSFYLIKFYPKIFFLVG